MKRISQQVKKKSTENKRINQINDLNHKDIVEYYEYKVNNLENNLNKLQIEFKDLKNELFKSESDKEFILNQKNRIITYLNQELNTKANEIQLLNLRIQSFNASKQFDQKKFGDILKKQEADYKENIDSLVNAKIQLETKLTNVENFIEEKITLEDKLKESLSIIENLKEDNCQIINEIEKAKLVEKKKLKKELIERLNGLVKEFRCAFHQQINDASKMIARENHKLRADIKKITETSNNLLEECERLKEKQSKSKAEISYLLKSEEQLSLKYKTSTKIIQMYMEKEKIKDEEIDIIKENDIKIRELKNEIFRFENEVIYSKNKANLEKKSCDCESKLTQLQSIRDKLLEYLKDISTYVLYDKQNDQFKMKMMEKISLLFNNTEIINFDSQ